MKDITNNGRSYYTAAEIEITVIDSCDVITTSSPADGFWAEEQSFEELYSQYEW